MASRDSMEVMYFISLLKDFLVSLLVVWQRQHDDTQATFTNVKLFLWLSMKHDADGQSKDRLNRVVKLQRKISDALLPSLLYIYNQCFICRVSSIVFPLIPLTACSSLCTLGEGTGAFVHKPQSYWIVVPMFIRLRNLTW